MADHKHTKQMGIIHCCSCDRMRSPYLQTLCIRRVSFTADFWDDELRTRFSHLHHNLTVLVTRECYPTSEC